MCNRRRVDGKWRRCIGVEYLYIPDHNDLLRLLHTKNYAYLAHAADVLAQHEKTEQDNDELRCAIVDAKLAVEISISLIGVMAFWLGLVKLAEKSGIIKVISKLVQPITDFLFPEIPRGHSALGNIAMNVSANALGVTNAATPVGIKAMQEMQELNENKDTATNPMCTFLAINTAGFQIIPATVIAILIAAGDKNPMNIVLPTLIVTGIAFVSAIITAKILKRFSNTNQILPVGSSF